jgi:bifunctional non-homologous end joining protein LigD
MRLTDFITIHRSRAAKPTADIRSRWASRIIARNLDQLGQAGAQTYLRDYGRGISAPKVIALAIQAECEGCDDLALGFWKKAYELITGLTLDETGATPPADPGSPTPAQRDRPPTIPGLPAHLQPGLIFTMQPVDAAGTHDDYIHNPAYLGQPKRDGSRIVVVASPSGVTYQSRSTTVLASPGISFDGAFRRAAEARGPFVLDGEHVFLDASGGEHRTGAQAAQANATNGHPDARVRCRICVFKALYAHGRDLTEADEEARINAAGPLVAIAQGILIKAGVEDYDIEQVPTAWTTAQKHALVCRQQDEGREGEVWVQRQTRYLGGTHGEVMVRTKYLTESEVIVTGLTPTTAPGRAFGALEVGEPGPDGAVRPVGRVGTGFSQGDAQEIAALVARHPGQVRVRVRHQGRTENGQLWHARFLQVVASADAAG